MEGEARPPTPAPDDGHERDETHEIAEEAVRTDLRGVTGGAQAESGGHRQKDARSHDEGPKAKHGSHSEHRGAVERRMPNHIRTICGKSRPDHEDAAEDEHGREYRHDDGYDAQRLLGDRTGNR